ncbi:MAG: hypothetical protein WC371_03490 [Parachlamydiales bacterium]|jgi:hypothetical protein
MRFLLLLLCSSAFATTIYHYENWLEGKKSPLTWEVDETKDGILLKAYENIGQTTLECTPAFAQINNYVFSSKDKKSSYSIQRQDNKLVLEVQTKNRNRTTTRKTVFKMTNPWVQQFGFGLKPFIISKNKKLEFCVINTTKPDLIEMIARKKEKIPLKIKDKTYQAQKVEVTLTGLKKLFWKAALWFDLESFDMLKYEADSGPATPTTTILFIGKEKASFMDVFKKK